MALTGYRLNKKREKSTGLNGLFRHGFRIVVLSLVIISGSAFPGARCLETDTFADGDSAESKIDYPKKIPSRATWEKIVSFPGAIVFFPFKVIYIATEAAFELDYEVPYVSWVADIMVSDNGRRSLLPTYGSLRGGGLKYKHKGLISENSIFDITSTIWLKNRSMQRIRIRDLDLAGGAATAGLKAEYLILPDERFYGTGMNSEKEGKTNFAWEKISLDLSLGRKFSQKVKADLVFTYQRNNILPGRENSIPSTTDIYDDISIPGLETGIELAGGDFEIKIDSRNHPGVSTAGWEISLEAGLLWQFENREFGFWESSFDIKRYVHLFYNRYMVFRTAAQNVDPLSERNIPFYYLSEIGQWNTIRGFSRSRFRDRDLLLGSVEYRWPLTPYFLHALIFVDAGKVSGDIFDSITENNFEITYGIGILGWYQNGVLIRAEIGKSKDQFRFNLNFN
jgi:hypothetical protein